MTRYQKRISGPMLDRIDIHIEVSRADFEKPSDNRQGEASEEIRAWVEAARQRQRERFASCYINGDVVAGSGHLRVTVTPEEVTVDFIRASLSAQKNGIVAFTYFIE